MKLKEICEIKTGEEITKKDCYENGKYYVRGGGKGIYGLTNKWNVPENSITITRSGTPGLVLFNTQKFFCADKSFYLDIFDPAAIDVYFLYCYLKSIEPKIMNMEEGSMFRRVHKKDVEKIEVSLPSFEEQQKIAKMFKLLSNEINNFDEKTNKLKKFEKGLFQKMFV